jgi:hypothetical protein
MQLNLKISSGVALVLALVIALVLIVFDGGSGVKVKIERGTATGEQVRDLILSGQPSKPEPRLTRAVRIAKEYWGRVACQNVVTYKLGKLKGLWGYASWDDKNGRYTDCVVIYNQRVFGHGKNTPFSVFCQVTVHEYGHLLGEVHSRDPDDVMYDTATPRNTPRACKRDQDNADVPDYAGPVS